ncbi:hypothetical protein [Trichoplusia ni ascovirus 2c]|uniref:hypothetical protein n=1 Tax=Trichoplusia ni ascovirus 2c TaxID=328615 RepID=UPI0000E4424D|nr:hypothetical protein TNAV2c_gp117 [Trichoplusia ni ascovirus 2c]ABF70634.1 hypothetical protein [Trichoplusia ni ascovirus 2c]
MDQSLYLSLLQEADDIIEEEMTDDEDEDGEAGDLDIYNTIEQYNYGDRPSIGDVNQHSINSKWSELYKKCEEKIHPDYDELYKNSVRPNLLTDDVLNKRFRNPGAVFLGFCLYLQLKKYPSSSSSVKDELKNICESNTWIIEQCNLKPSDVLREYSFFNINL